MFSGNQTNAEIIFVTGAPGSGKGTQCQLLAKHEGYYTISTGELVRNLLKSNDPTFEPLRNKVKAGELLDDETITAILTKEIISHPEVKHFLIDGYPRTVEQCKLFEATIKPCDKVLFLDAPQEILENRLALRAQVENRLDDNPDAIQKRLTIYKEKTAPVIDLLSKNKNFMHINAAGSIAETSKAINNALQSHNIQSVNLIEFLSNYIRTGNFYDAVENLEKQYHTSDFKIDFILSTLFYIVQNKEDVKKVLNANAVAGFQNHNFDVAHGHMMNINALPAFVDGKLNPIWQAVHKAVLHSVGNAESIQKMVAKHFPKFLADKQFALDVNFEKFMESFWCEFMFGKKVNVQQFSQVRAQLISALKYSYYDSRLKNIPVIGTQACKLFGYMKKNEFANIDKMLKSFLEQADDCLMSKFRNDLLANTNFPQKDVDTAVLDNAFILILALDFIQNAMYETLVEVVKNGLKTTEARKAVYSQGLHDGFLFPFRTRVPQNDLQLSQVNVTHGTPIYINLLKSGLYHSAGPRMCAGMGVAQWIREAIWDQLQNVEFDLINVTHPPEREKISHSKDVPISPERYEVNWHYARDYLQKVLPHYQFKGVDEFFDVLKIYEKPFLSHYITQSFIEEIEKLNLDRSTLCIAAPELRGIPAAAAVAEALQVPLVIIRKQGKTPGPIASKQYANAYSQEVIELSQAADIKDKNVIFIDDGIASGGTTVSSCDLIKDLGGNIALILAMINHKYKDKIPALAQYPVKTLFDFAAKAPVINLNAARQQHGFFQAGKKEISQPQETNTFRNVI